MPSIYFSVLLGERAFLFHLSEKKTNYSSMTKKFSLVIEESFLANSLFFKGCRVVFVSNDAEMSPVFDDESLAITVARFKEIASAEKKKKIYVDLRCFVTADHKLSSEVQFRRNRFEIEEKTDEDIFKEYELLLNAGRVTDAAFVALEQEQFSSLRRGKHLLALKPVYELYFKSLLNDDAKSLNKEETLELSKYILEGEGKSFYSDWTSALSKRGKLTHSMELGAYVYNYERKRGYLLLYGERMDRLIKREVIILGANLEYGREQKRKYTNYAILVKLDEHVCSFIVFRRYSMFENTYKELQALFPKTQFPFPLRTLVPQTSTDTKVVIERMEKLQEFLQFVFEMDEALVSDIFMKFLFGT